MSMSQPPLLEAHALTKSFGAVRALDGADFELRRDEIHALVGDNGAGKSTLIKVLSGVHLPDGGTLAIDGKKVRFASPHDAQAAGIETVYQDLALAGTLDAPSNVFLGREVLRGGPLGRLRFIDRKAMREGVERELQRLEQQSPR
jgi:simple sugar transport system ATP-binding protein